MSWQSVNNHQWYKGDGPARAYVVGPCRCKLNGDATHVLKFNQLNNNGQVMGQLYVAGVFDPLHDFDSFYPTDEATYNLCRQNIGCGGSADQQHDNSTPTGKDFDWRLILGAALILIALILIAMK